MPTGAIPEIPRGLFLGALGFFVAWASMLVGAAQFVLPRVFPARTREPVGWRFRHLVLVVLIVALSIQVLDLVVPIADASVVWKLGGTAIAFAAGFVVLLVIGARSGYATLAGSGFTFVGAPRASVFAAAAYAVFFPAFLASALVWIGFLSAIGVAYEPQDVLRELARTAVADRALAVTLAVLVVPFLEEALFRGFLQSLFVQRLGPVLGIGLAAATFALLHGVNAFGPIFVLGILLGTLAYHTRTLAASFTVHACHNGLMCAVLFLFPEVAEKLAGTAGALDSVLPLFGGADLWHVGTP